ncbi:MAG: TatD family hydrolase [Coriobacteriales bacterium]|jgi:TatD DNase family protein|nr:TatD family hydrolase [Coriobacteriales bacterium]
MRTTSAAATDVADQATEPKIHWDDRFRDAKGREVAPPALAVPTADTHVHLDMLHHPALALARCASHGVDFLVTVVDPTEDPAYTYKNLGEWERRARDLLDDWNRHVPVPRVRVIVGCHPHNASKFTREIEQLLIRCASRPSTSGIGEIGLDYHYDLSPRDLQREAFKRQLALANEMMLPVALHLREAHDDGLAILKEEGLPVAGTLLHCFNLDFATLAGFLDLGCHVAFGGPLTFKKCDELRDAARRTPLERIVTETDAPFMAPVPLRGTICGPEDVVFTAARLAETFGLEGREAVKMLTRVYENAHTLFDRDTSTWQDKPKAATLLAAKATGIPGAVFGAAPDVAAGAGAEAGAEAGAATSQGAAPDGAPSPAPDGASSSAPAPSPHDPEE